MLIQGVTAELAAAKKERDDSAGAAVPVTKKIKNSMKRRVCTLYIVHLSFMMYLLCPHIR